MIICRASAAAAAHILIAALAAGALVCLRAQGIEDLAVLPDLIKRPFAHVACLLDHIRAGAHLAHRADDAVRQAGQAAAGEARADVHTHLLGHARELRRAGRLDVNFYLLLLFHDAAQQLLVLLHLNRRLLDHHAAANRNQEEDILRHRALFNREIDHIENLGLVPIHDRRVNLEWQTDCAAVFHALHGALKGMRIAAEGVVLFLIEAVQADAHGHRATVLELLRNLAGDHHSVGAEHRAQPLRRRICDQFKDIRAHQRLTAAEDHNLEARAGNLIDQLLAFLGAQLRLLGVAGVLIAVAALQVAAVRRHP